MTKGVEPAAANQAPAKRSPHPLGNQLLRASWSFVYIVLFRTSPRVCHGWRRFLLRIFGARLSGSSRVYAKAKVWAPWNLTMGERSTLADDVDCYSVAPVTIGSRTVVSQYSYLCTATHDFEDPARPLLTEPIVIGDDVWLCADVFVAPGVTIGSGTVVGARSSVFKNLPAWKVCSGSPANPSRDRVIREDSNEGSN